MLPCTAQKVAAYSSIKRAVRFTGEDINTIQFFMHFNTRNQTIYLNNNV